MVVQWLESEAVLTVSRENGSKEQGTKHTSRETHFDGLKIGEVGRERE